MKTPAKLTRVALAVALTVGVATTAVAASGQSSAMRGSIVGPQGNPAAGSTITILHQPSGTVKELQVNEEGAFSALGLRVGGPYTIIIESEKFQDKIIEDVYLTLNDTFALKAQLDALADVERITVTGAQLFNDNQGSSSTFGQKAIENTPTFNRDLKDVVRLNPLAVVSADGSELSVAGSNPKFNSLTIDGVGVNDTFGLNSNGYPAQRPPISLDAVEQISINVAPFTARAGKFTGGSLDVVTKSGTNEFGGTVFYEKVPFTGDAYNDKIDEEFDVDNEEVSFGASLGGALIQDTLFFFASYEEWEEEVAFNYDMDSLDGHNVTNEQVDTFLNTLSSVYQLTDSKGTAPSPDSDKKTLIKLDWNINSDHRADFTYSYQDNSSARNYTRSNSQLNMTSNGWSQDSETTIYTGHVYSYWTDDFSSEISISYKDYTQASNTNSDWGEINVRTGTGTIIAGQDENRHANVLKNEVWTLGFHGVYLAGDVEYKFGLEMEDTWNYNVYGRDSAGTWSFETLEDFENRAPDLVEYSNAYTNDINDIAYDVDSTLYTAYGEANFELFEDFEVTAGLRVEYLTVEDSPMLNQNFLDTYNFANTENLDGNTMVLPRLGFEWSINEDLTLRGGVGRFTGGSPLVWISNAYTKNGVALDQYSTESIAPENVMFDQVPQVLKDQLSIGSGSTNSIDPDFDMPSDWRYQIAADYIFDVEGLGNNFSWTTELTYVDKKDAAAWVELARTPEVTLADGRIIYGSVYDGTDNAGNYDIQLTNASDGGRSILFTTALGKQWDNGISLNMSYTHQDITEGAPGTSSTAESNFIYNIATNRNEPNVDTAYFEVPHRFVLNLGYTHQFFAGYNTDFNLFFERRSGRRFSHTLGLYNDPDFGDQFGINGGDYQIYIPEGPNDPLMDFEGGLSYEEIMEVVTAAGLEGYAGSIIPKNTGSQPWITSMDLYISQEVPGFYDDHKGKVYLSIENFANLLNDDWGKVYQVEYSSVDLFDLQGVNENNQYQYTNAYDGNAGQNWDEFEVDESTWRIKVGVRYTF